MARISPDLFSKHFLNKIANRFVCFFNYLIALMAGTILPLLFVLTKETLNNKFQSVEEIQKTRKFIIISSKVVRKEEPVYYFIVNTSFIVNRSFILSLVNNK